ncbi:hypothetical protein BDA96_06G304600 [Sorghum bicolor]|uniref:PHD-type domain-containing protein n=3 Tax=Sorghum bicolor TaxID=4558 RepID=A0A1Z5RGZ9_SORBI|nr:increased DNA methylation 1 isoform X1 [Sorghum bicolor]XP_021318701.1 increased DNA methylation 1 isoform X1 [Sorghum bicolor]KAG0528275.1 hypothetical protein BDA96_06G304600 [Sorghum bicolor]OQU82646.1 hypothetical protein SORBI_3006G280200 [Sorghum bicolor]|eukprot:XP_021318700.1 increased DNA methylation 1 isoform X1 [Sorghum bicolor]
MAAGGGHADDMLGFKEDDAMRFIFGEDIMGMEDHGAFDRSLLELQVFKEVFCGAAATTHLPAEMDLGFVHTAAAHLKPTETSTFPFPFPSHAQHQPAAATADPHHTMDHSRQPNNGPHHDLHLQVQEHAHPRAQQNGTDLDAAAFLQGFMGSWQPGDKCATHPLGLSDDQHQFGLSDDQNQFIGSDAAHSILDVHTQDVGAGMCNTLGLGCSSSTSAVDDPMPSYIEALAEISEFQSSTLLSDPFLHQWLQDQQQFPSNACFAYDQGQMDDTTYPLCASTKDFSDRGGVEQHLFYSEEAHSTPTIPQQSQFWFSPGQFTQLDGTICQNGTPDANISCLDEIDVHGSGSAVHSGSAAAVSKKALGRDIPDQLEAHAHRLFKDSGWTIKPRKRNDRAKMASYFTAPNREAVHTSLTQAWKFCGNKLYEASPDSERGKYPKEWSDVDAFWKDLTDTMAYVDRMLANQQNALTLLQRWQILDPFVAVVFISRKITALQQHKTLRAVDSSTFVLDGSSDMSLESKTMHKASELLASRMIQLTPLITDSDCSTLATESYNGHQSLQSCHDVEDSNDRDTNPKLSCNESLNYNATDQTKHHIDASDQTKHHIDASDDGRQTCAQPNALNSSVKKSRKKSKKTFDISSAGLDGTNVATMDMADPGNTNAFEEHGMCSGFGTLKDDMKAETKSEKLDKDDQGRKCDMLLSSVSKQLKDYNTFPETHCTTRESQSDATAFCHDDKVWKKILPSHGEFYEDSQSDPTGNTVPVELSHESSADVLGTYLACDSQICKRGTAKMKPKGWLKYMKKRPRELRINDEDLLITAIVKNKDLGTCHKFASGFSAAKKFKKLKSHKKGNKLISKIGKAGTNLLGGKRVSLARKTVICWLLATGFLTVKDVIQYRDPKSNEVIKDGLVTWEGVVCNCCKKTLSVSGFMAHAGFSHPQSSLGLFLESGKSYTLCQVEAWSAEFMSRRSNAWGRKVEAIDESDDTCGFCGDGGELLCCDNCPSTYHPACLSAKELPEGSWYCHNCTCQICGGPVSEKEVSTFSAIFKCFQCGDAYHDTCIEQEKLPLEDQISQTWFCGKYCKEIFIGLRSHVGTENILDSELSWSILRCNNDGQKLHSVQKIACLAECNMKLAVALTLLEECFIRMVDPRTGVDMIPHVLYNKGSNFARVDYQGFYTVILEKGDEILCVASIRVHGTKAAELPFIATSVDYRRQGMCRILMNIIEKMLCSFNVKMLVLSAIPELVSTWVSGFGFKPIEDAERKQLHNVNLMLFPGTSLLTKRLDGFIMATKPGEAKDIHEVFGVPNGKFMPNGKASEHFELHDLDLSGTEFKAEVSMSGPFRTLKHECGSAAWFQSTKLALGEV